MLEIVFGEIGCMLVGDLYGIWGSLYLDEGKGYKVDVNWLGVSL